jgi:hypothetical protein
VPYGTLDVTNTEATGYGGSLQASNRDRIFGFGNSFVVGGSIDAATVMWWLAQSAQVTAAIIRQDDADHIGLALLNFIEFYGNSDGVWAAPATFDIPILESAMRRMQPDRRSAVCRIPWTHREIHCWSTVRKLLKIPKAPNPEAHHALADARAQVVAFRQGWHMLKASHLLCP